MNLKKLAVEQSKRLHLRDAGDQLIFADDAQTLPVAVTICSPGSKQYARAKAEQNSRILARLNRKGKIANLSAEQTAQETAEFLAACTIAWENAEHGDLTVKSDGLSMAIYSDESIGFIADQVAKELGEWGNFLGTSSAN